MPVLRFQVTLDRKQGVPADDVVNVWHFDTDQTIAEDADDIADRLVDFYATSQWGAFSYWASTLNGTGTIKVYDMADALDRPVRYTTDFVHPIGNSAHPNEVAIAVSMYADLTGIPERIAGGPEGPEGDTKPRARKRGRVFIGPVSTQAGGAAAGQADNRIDTQALNYLAGSVAALATGPDAGDGRLCVFSPTIFQERLDLGDTRQQAADAAASDVVGGWIDNAWDIQRRRGAKATVRFAWAPA